MVPIWACERYQFNDLGEVLSRTQKWYQPSLVVREARMTSVRTPNSGVVPKQTGSERYHPDTRMVYNQCSLRKGIIMQSPIFQRYQDEVRNTPGEVSGIGVVPVQMQGRNGTSHRVSSPPINALRQLPSPSWNPHGTVAQAFHCNDFRMITTT